MVNASPESIVKAVLEFYGYSFSQQLRIKIQQNDPSELFKLLVASSLFGGCSSWKTTVATYREFERQQWLTPDALARSSADDRFAAMDRGGCWQHNTTLSQTTGRLAVNVIERYNGDLRQLRERAGNDPEKQRRLLEEISGIGQDSVEFFFGEMQLVWSEWYPYMGDNALRGARKLRLADNVQELMEFVPKRDFPCFAASLIQLEQDDAVVRILEESKVLEGFIEIPL